jgi:hypothetical protein
MVSDGTGRGVVLAGLETGLFLRLFGVGATVILLAPLVVVRLFVGLAELPPSLKPAREVFEFLREGH